jgi:hypothetical protein
LELCGEAAGLMDGLAIVIDDSFDLGWEEGERPI